MGIDYGTKRTGIAVTDPLRLIASAHSTIPTEDVFDFLVEYVRREEVQTIVVGMPTHADGNPVPVTQHIVGFVRKLKKELPGIEVDTIDERYSSARASDIIRQSGYKKKKRHDKSLVDKIAAALILEDYMKKKFGW